MDWPSPQGIFDNIVADLVIRVVVVVVAYMVGRRIGKEHYLSPPIIFLVIVGIYGLLIFAWNQTVAFQQERAQIVTTKMSNKELADIIQQWLDDFHLRYQVSDREDAEFSFIIQGNDGARIGIAKLKKEHQQFITLFCHVLLEPESLTKMKSLPVPTQQWIYDQAAMELLRQNIVVTGNLFTGMQLEARLAVSEMTEGKLMDRLDELYSALTLVRVKLRSF